MKRRNVVHDRQDLSRDKAHEIADELLGELAFAYVRPALIEEERTWKIERAATMALGLASVCRGLSDALRTGSSVTLELVHQIHWANLMSVSTTIGEQAALLVEILCPSPSVVAAADGAAGIADELEDFLRRIGEKKTAKANTIDELFALAQDSQPGVKESILSRLEDVRESDIEGTQ